MYIFEQLFSNHGYEYVIAALTVFAFIVIFSMLGDKKKY